jgi:hypothetical protein
MRKFSKEEWQIHLSAADKHPQGIKGYCREHGIANSRFHYWKKKLLSKGEAKAPTFARVEVLPAREPAEKLPNPKWLAEFLRAYAAGAM